MKNKTIILWIILICVLTSCGNFTKIQKTVSDIGYKKIAPQEAQNMMNGDIIILDVRTQDEFDNGHIKNAILLPDYDIKEKAKTVLPNKEKPILVYCETGVRSESVSKILLGMGYTAVFDFGGIKEWPGEIVWNAEDTIFYNYFGGSLPEDIVKPIDYTITKKIGDKIEELVFRIEGVSIAEYGLNHDKSKYYATCVNKISKITILNTGGNIKQEFPDLSIENYATEKEQYGLSFDDWNFDGYTDISLWRYRGGTSTNSPHYFCLWDNTTQKYVMNTELEELSDISSISIDNQAQQIISHVRYSAAEHSDTYYKYVNSSYIAIKQIERLSEPSKDNDDKYILHVIVKDLVNGKMKITEDYYENLEG